jgi:hypothetical protein
LQKNKNLWDAASSPPELQGGGGNYYPIQPAQDPFLKGCALKWLLDFKTQSFRRESFWREIVLYLTYPPKASLHKRGGLRPPPTKGAGRFANGFPRLWPVPPVYGPWLPSLSIPNPIMVETCFHFRFLARFVLFRVGFAFRANESHTPWE